MNRSGKMAAVIFCASKTGGVIVVSSEERAETLRKFAYQLLNGTGLELPRICVPEHRYEQNGLPKPAFTVLDDYWKQEE